MDSPSSARSSPSKAFGNPFYSPTKALNPLSPQRMNQQNMPDSPTNHTSPLNYQRKTRGISDVQSKVAFLNGLSKKGSPAGSQSQAQSSGNPAALQRAILGREEAESQLANVSAQLSEAQSRERRISERLESLLEELQSAKERQAHERNVFEKEIRKSRKEAFRAGSSLVKLQEDLRQSKTESKGLKDEVRAERESKEKAKQEAFERAYALAGLIEEMEVLKERLRTAEAIADANTRTTRLEARAREIPTKDVGRMSLAEGDLDLLATPKARRPLKRPAEEPIKSPSETNADANSVQETPPKKARLSEMSLEEKLKAGMSLREIFEQEPVELPRDLSEADELREKVEELEELIQHHESVRDEAYTQIEYMRWECSVRLCQCRIDEEKAKDDLRRQLAGPNEPRKIFPSSAEMIRRHEESFKICLHEAHPIEAVKEEPELETEQDPLGKKAVEYKQEVNTEELELNNGNHPVEEENPKDEEVEFDEEIVEEDVFEDDAEEDPDAEPLVTFSPATGTFHTIPSPARQSPRKQPEDLISPRKRGFIAQPQFQSPLAKHAPERQRSPEVAAKSDVPFQACEPQPHNSPGVVDVPWDYPMPKRSSGQPRKEAPEFKIPLRNEPVLQNPAAAVPDAPINREDALAQIRARRGRTNTMKRSVSASEGTFRSGGMGVTPVRVARRIPGVQNAEKSKTDVRSRRDLSAPVRMFHR
ncbi:hypothetical protein FE257_003888 [Aspergillus nanangensis]|uniref:Uncharacterized protein n=1 Tax=Aspergillus nanangensis TaxID=2582783 RepID=A0AAD4GPB3_ASPNN|nr:hypothetical protein FE257_003888 [Aspergillus nanangensis]